MDTLTATALYRSSCLQIECETTLKLLNTILSNNSRVMEGLNAPGNDSNYVDECCEYQHQSQISILQANLILQKFLKTPVPARINNKSMITFEISNNLENNCASSPCVDIPLPLKAMVMSMSENCTRFDEQEKIANLSEMETKVSPNQSEVTLDTCKQVVETEEGKDNNTLSSDFSNTGNDESVQVVSNSVIEEPIKITYNFAQIPFNKENYPKNPIESRPKSVVEKEDVVPDVSTVENLKEQTKNYADILKKKCNENEEKKSKVGSNSFYPEFSNKKKLQEVKTTWTSLKLSSNISSKFSDKCSNKTSDKEKPIEISTKPDSQNCHQDLQETVELKDLSANPESLGSKNDQDIQQSSGEYSESVKSETFKSISDCTLAESLDHQNYKENQQTCEPQLENTNFETSKSASLSLQSEPTQAGSSDSQTYYSAVPQQSKSFCRSSDWSEKAHLNQSAKVSHKVAHPKSKNDFKSFRSKFSNSSKDKLNTIRTSTVAKKCTNKKIENETAYSDSTPDFLAGEDTEQYMPISMNDNTSRWKSETYANNNKLDKDIVKQLKQRNIMSIEERHRRNIPRARMPDISMKPSSIKLSQKENNILKIDSDDEIEEQEHFNDENDVDGVMPEEEIEDIKLVVPHSLEPNYKDYFMISDITSPGSFYIQVANEISTCLDELSDRIEWIYKKDDFIKFSSKFEAKREIGDFFCLEINGFWIRVEVINWLITSHNTNVIVQSIDYGGYYERDYRALRPLPHELYSIPRIAQRCHLADLYPINSNRNIPARKWEDSSNFAFIKLCGDITNTYFEFITGKYCNMRQSYAIDFKISDGESIANILVKEKLAIHIKNKRTDFFADLGLTNTDPLQMPKEQIWNAYWYNENITSPSNEQSSSYLSTSRADNKYMKTNNEVIVTKQCLHQDLPTVGEERRVMITHVVDIETFYGHIDNGYSVHPGEPLHNLHEFMNRYNIVKTYTSLTRTPLVNQLVIAPHLTYFWSRAQVRQIEGPDENDQVHIQLFYIDYGCTEWVPLSAIRSMVRILLQFPCLAIEFKMYNIEHKFGASREQEKQFLELYRHDELSVVIKAVPGHVVVTLQDKNNIDIGETLINHGIGQWKKDHLFPCADSNLLID